MYFHGCGKTADELRAIVDRRVAFDVIDNREELERLAALASPGDPVDVMLRINTGIEAHTHAYIRTGGENTKFGFPTRRRRETLERLAELPQLRLVGLHAHIGSQIADVSPFSTNVDELVRGRGARRAARGLPVGELICGGGIGVEEGPGDPRPLDLDALAGRAGRAGGRQRLPARDRAGRALVARAGARSTASWRSSARDAGASSSSTAGSPTTRGRCCTAPGITPRR